MGNAQQVAVELFSVPWGHHMAILGKAKSAEDSLFYVHEAYANGWPREPRCAYGHMNIVSSKTTSRENIVL